MYCIKCGIELPEGANYCLKCGTLQKETHDIQAVELCHIEIRNEERWLGPKYVYLIAESSGKIIAQSEKFPYPKITLKTYFGSFQPTLDKFNLDYNKAQSELVNLLIKQGWKISKVDDRGRIVLMQK